NIHGAAINVDQLRRNGSTYSGEGCPDFLTANDAWFMPIVQKTGPDGSLYVLDWYDRYHCYQDARRDPEGIDRLKGRLYRVRYGDTPRAGAFDLGAESDEQLIARLASPNVYFRDAAQRLLSERRSPAAALPLQRLVLDSTAKRKTRMHALWALLGAGDLPADFHLQLLRHEDPLLRAWGVRAAGNARRVDERIVAHLSQLRDPAPDVSLQLAIAARKVEGLEPGEVLVDVLAHAGSDPLIPQIVWRNLLPSLDERERALALLFRRHRRIPDGVGLSAPRVVEYWLATKPAGVAEAVAAIELLLEQDHTSSAAAACLERIAERVESRTLEATVAEPLRAALAPRLQRLAALPATGRHHTAAVCLATLWGDDAGRNAARRLVADPAQPGSERLPALEALIAVDDPDAHELAAGLLASSNRDGEFARKVIFAVGETDSPRTAALLLDHYPRLPPDAQPAAIEVLCARRAWGSELLDAIEDRAISRDALNANQVRRLLKSADEKFADRVRAVWGTLRTERNPEREQTIGSLRKLLAATPGDAQRGVAVFQKSCAQCHKIYGQGEEVGPDLTRNGRNSWEQLLSNVFDPSLVIGSDYQARVLLTTDGRSFTGLVVEEGPERVALKVQGGKTEVISRGDIEAMETTALSLMPEGLERQLAPQELADLMAFLALDRHPSDPEARLLDGAPAER
ncbi:MAG: c-type cytochrome, partial [Planctomycetaceae bacterium]|nr:c-type cytochrome [Planctomycetaceae bacterium]